MKKVFIIIPIFLFVFFGTFSRGVSAEKDDGDIPKIKAEVLLTYFEALKNGDVETIKTLLSKKFYEENKALLENNKTYPDFLRKFYYKAQFEITDISIDENGGYASVLLEFPNAEKNILNLRLVKEFNVNGADNTAQWKIEGQP